MTAILKLSQGVEVIANVTEMVHISKFFVYPSCNICFKKQRHMALEIRDREAEIKSWEH